ncbi:sodium/potassium/calcium exchanger [Holotrichia oblita]|uniref:Sodium/potassium/calcium exchanger n=1 Tax=Holotrichia oblita TaxID=644536 RepID=A0ACB9TG85_HOLOL|nr:sodium/potassium/calcium exchanger [Holotrichia oblita]
MLKIVFYFIISSLVLTYQQDIPRALARSTEIDEIADLESNCTQTSLEGNGCEISNDGSHKKRRTHIWFAVFRANDVPNVTEEECGSSADDFPSFLTLEQRSNGGIVIHILIAIYCFCLIAIVCDHYFIPCVEEICSTLQLSEDVAAATFMAVATSAPELFVNVIGTFLLDSDIGIGTIVGSSMFNTIGVAAIGGLAAPYAKRLTYQMGFGYDILRRWWLPSESFSIAILSRKGEGKMGVSNALGANTMNILLSLGMPWFIKTLMMGAKDDSYIQINLALWNTHSRINRGRSHFIHFACVYKISFIES